MASLAPIEHVVVVMLENRSYDNVLGKLYSTENSPPYDKAPPGQEQLNGLSGSETNPTTSGKPIRVGNQTSPTRLTAGEPSFAATTIPLINPGEPFRDMAQQYLGTPHIPKSNPYISYPPTDPAGIGQLMQGFGYNYETKVKNNKEHLGDVMNYFTPQQMPVSAYLARNYSVCDSWYASLPSHTYSNRAFMNSGAPGVAGLPGLGYYSFVDDSQYFTGSFGAVDLPTVFESLEKVSALQGKRQPWKLYFHDFSIAVQTTPYLKRIAGDPDNQQISTYDLSDWGEHRPKQLRNRPSTFVEDLESGNLPFYTLIEPRYTSDYGQCSGRLDPCPAPNSNHPGSSSFWGGDVSAKHQPIDAASGELLLMDIYNSLRKSPCWEKTLLIVTYDEAGGIFDHVPPENITPPGEINWPSDSPPFKSLPKAQLPIAQLWRGNTAKGFDYNVTGGRVPTIVISPFVESGSTIHLDNPTMPFDHTSVIRTLFDYADIPQEWLTERDKNAPSIAAATAVHTKPVNAAGTIDNLIVASPASLAFELSLIKSQHSLILEASSGSADAELSISCEADWLSISPQSYERGKQSWLLTALKHGLKSGTYSANLKLEADNAMTKLVPVSLRVV